MFDRLSGVKLDTTFVIEIGRIISNLATFEQHHLGAAYL